MTEYEYDVPHPGEFIQDELEAREWAQRDLAFVLGISEPELNKIVRGKTGISFEMSKALGKAFTVDPDFFANLQKAYDFSRAAEPDPSVEKRAALQKEYPVREMIRRGWIEADNVELQINRFLYRADNDNSPHVTRIRHAAKKTNAGLDATPAQLAWLYRVVRLATAMQCQPYSGRKLSDAVKARLKPLMLIPDGVQQVPQILAECGVRFVIVEGLPGAKIDGVCIWLDEGTPIIGMSLRYDRIDNFWFVLWHEIAHVLNDHGRKDGIWIVDVELEGERASDSATNSAQENEANRQAAEWCIPVVDWVEFFTRRVPYFSERDIVAFSKRMQVHPGIVVGQIQNRMKKYDFLRKHLVKVREHIIPTANADGWGHVASGAI